MSTSARASSNPRMADQVGTMTTHDSFREWVLREWRRQAIPLWRDVLAEARAAGHEWRATYAEWMLAEVLVDVEPERG